MRIRGCLAFAALVFVGVPVRTLAQNPPSPAPAGGADDYSSYLNTPLAVICNNPMRTARDSLAVVHLTGKSCEELNIPRATPDEEKSYASDSVVDVCNSPLKTIQQVHEAAIFGINCNAMRGPGGLISYGIYGYNHPTPAVCNAGNGLKTGLLGFVTGNSIGNKNFITGIGLLLSSLFAGCNNAPPSGQSNGNNVQPVVATPALSATPANTTVAVGQKDTVAISEPGYVGNFFATSLNPQIATIEPGPQKSAGGQAQFQITGVKSGAATFVIMDDGGQHTTSITVTVK